MIWFGGMLPGVVVVFLLPRKKVMTDDEMISIALSLLAPCVEIS